MIGEKRKANLQIPVNTIIVTILILTCQCVDTQTIRQIDAARLVEITYPPLTVREGKGLSIPVPPGEHPRVFFRKTDIPAIKAKMNHLLMAGCKEKIDQNASYTSDGKLAQGVKHNVDMRIISAIEAKAFLYALSNDKAMGNDAVDCIFNLNNSLIIDPAKADVCRDIGRIILATALVYDWCYDLIGESEKKSLIAIMESLATRMEIKWPYLEQNSVTGHGVEAQVARDMLACGIAIYNEKPEIYNRAAGRIFAEIIPAQNFGYRAGHHHQGSAYGPSRYQWEVYTTLLFDRMGYPQVTSELQGKIPYYWMYTRRPDGQLLRDGDDFTEQYTPSGKYWTIPTLAYVASYYRDPLLMTESMKQKAIGQNPLFDLLLVDPDLMPGHVSTLPLTRYFPSPFGGMVARTGWDEGLDANTVVAEMKIAELNFANHQHLDAGSFQVYYKGPLAVQSGIYQGAEGGYGCGHFTNYYQRTIAHNCMLVYDPAEKFTWHRRDVNNDGGQRFPAGAAEAANLDAVLHGEYRTGEVLAHGFGPDSMKPEYSYLKGDITQAYTGKVRNYQRAFVFLNLNNSQVPAALVVYDYLVSSDKNLKKTWLLHCVQEPVLNGNTCQLVRNEKGYNGKLVNTTLMPLPGNLVMEKTGGQGNEFSVNGINYPQRMVAENNSSDGAAWRVEVSPKNPSETDHFLNVMQVMNGSGKPVAVGKIETDRLVGVKIADRIVLFSKNGEVENRSIHLEITGKGMHKLLITDLEKGLWEISCPGNPSNTVGTVSNDNNLIYFQALPGNYLIAMKQ